jgi:hypothetical protein
MVGLLVVAMIIADLATKSIGTVNPATQEAMRTAEEELGLEGDDTLSHPARALRIAREGRSQAEEAMRRHEQNIQLMRDVVALDTIEMAADSIMKHRKPIRVPSKP